MQLWTEAKIAGEEQEGLRKRLLSLVLVLESIIPDKLLVEKQLSLLKYPALPVVLFSFYVRILVSVIKEFLHNFPDKTFPPAIIHLSNVIESLLCKMHCAKS